MSYITDEQLRLHIQQGLMLYEQQKMSKDMFIEGIQILKAKYGDDRVRSVMKKMISSYTSNKYQPSTYNFGKGETTYSVNEDKLLVKAGEIKNFISEKFMEEYNRYIQGEQIKNVFYERNEQGENKNIAELTKSVYKEGENKTERSDERSELGEAQAMRGIDYLHTNMWNSRSYKHMRSILQKCWDINQCLPSERFDIDGRFNYMSSDIANHILRDFSSDVINQAHSRAVEDLRQRGRGRPKGARNRPKTNNSSVELGELEDILNVEDQETSEAQTLENTEFKTEQKPQGDFVTRPELQQALVNVAGALQKGIDKGFNELNERMNAIELHKPTIIELKRAELPNVSLGVQHRAFPSLLKICSAQMRNGNRVIPWVYGPAGTGKSTAAENVGKALELNFYTLGKTLAKFDVLGFINTSGYQTTEFRRAYENGGVFCADEMDSWSNEASVALNGALANGHCAFPDKTVKRHKDFVMICCANTTGAGATMDYVGRTKVDAATLDRFVSLYFPLDEALEDSLVADKKWLSYVRHVRARANASGINPKPLITPRAAIHGEALLAVDLPWDDVVSSCLRKGLSDQQWNLIK